jgi:uncharacterized protein YndB with AHSA1/START domain
MDPRFHFDASFTFEAEPAEVWRALADPERYRQWVPGLRVIEGGHLAPGATTHAVIQAPLPYRLHLSFRVLAVDPGRRVDVEVGGDLAGPGLLEIATAGDGSRLRLAWDVEAHDRLLRHAGRFGRPLVMWAHDRVIAAGVHRFGRALEASMP